MGLELLIGAGAVSSAFATGASEQDAPHLCTDEFLQIWNAADARLFTLVSPPRAEEAEQVKRLNPTAVSLCGSGVFSRGADGLREGIRALKTAGVSALGAGADLDEADQPFYFVRGGVRVGVYAIGEDSFLSATERSAGLNPVDPLELGDRIRDIKGSCDRLVALVEGGKERYPYPSPAMQRVCRKAADSGAALVICRLAGVVGCYEKWNNATIVYGLGAFLSRGGSGMLLRYRTQAFGADEVEFLPLEHSETGLALMTGDRADAMTRSFEQRSLRIRVQGFVEARFLAGESV